MNFKIDTKEKFYVITAPSDLNAANMAEELSSILEEYGNLAPHNIILKLNEVEEVSPEFIDVVVAKQAHAMEANVSFVLCELKPKVKAAFMQSQAADSLNIVPTESEAWDIVQMEEIEREYLD